MQFVQKLLFFKKNFSFEALRGINSGPSGLNIYFKMQQYSIAPYLAAGRDVSEREANISEILIILFVALDIFPLADGFSQVHHAQRYLYLNNKHY